VQDPRQSRDAVEKLFNNAREHGARDGRPEDLPGAGSNSAGAFTGRSWTLSGSAPSVEAAPTENPQDPEQPITHVITFWRNGFTVDDGELRLLEDPANRSFLESINNGECPRELAPQNRLTPVHVNLMRKDEDWKAPPKDKYKAFSGTGRSLRDETAEAAASQPAASGEVPNGDFVCDETRPTTRLQIRLHDGQRLVAMFNQDHTVGDIRNFLRKAQPGGAPSAYTLMTAPPLPTTLNDNSATLKDAGLLNAVILQKI